MLSDYLQGMILLRAIPKEWDNVASMYCNGMTMSNVTFVGVHDAIVAEFECQAKPSQVAHFADRISAVKRKGKSPSFKEQSKPKYSAPKAPDTDNAPSGSSNKKTRRGGKKERTKRAHLVSSALLTRCARLVLSFLPPRRVFLLLDPEGALSVSGALGAEYLGLLCSLNEGDLPLRLTAEMRSAK